MLRKLKALEGDMGLIRESESEEERSEEEEDPALLAERKRKRDMSEMEFGRKKWKGPNARICNLFLQGKCPRVRN